MKVKFNHSIYKQAQRFADITKFLVMTGNINRAKKCLKMAEDIYNSGTKEIKNIISNVYIYSVSSYLEIHHCNIKELLPNSLQQEYYKQANASGV
jgi:hypothetical protein